MNHFVPGIPDSLTYAESLFGLLKKITLCVCVSLMIVVPIVAHAQLTNTAGSTSTGNTSTSSSTTGSSTVTGATGNGLATSGTSIATAITSGASEWQSVTSTILTTATTGASTLSTESDKLAYALAVITIVIAAVEFAGTSHPASAWVQLFKTVGGLGFFAGTYTSYATAGPGLYSWFNTLAGDIQNSQNTSNMYTAADTIYNGILHSFDNVSITLSGIPVDQISRIIYADTVAILVLIIVVITCIVYMYYSYAGLVQAGVGIIFGKIAVALGFHTFTRSYFMSWLDFMIHAGMYTAVASAMNYLVITTVVQKISTVASSVGGPDASIVTMQSAIQMEVLSIFVLFLSLEIPKIAGMFGGGSVGGGTLLNSIVGKKG